LILGKDYQKIGLTLKKSLDIQKVIFVQINQRISGKMPG